ncbi:hypothetical protein Pyn_09956 [Prunus yedoensis var. nudiflora]|uniref:Uncharacterized protein n=1 Tax=Prunus yedoensis var. nudiflora TaxID=2094558 RepID=A0A314XN00_PRUYE|nr:hypothetical protein Pyn_09956 [Prunus yedoensis var. nudiflora]
MTAPAMENGGGVGWWRRSGMELKKPGSTKIPSPVHPSPAVRVGCESAVPENSASASSIFILRIGKSKKVQLVERGSSSAVMFQKCARQLQIVF